MMGVTRKRGNDKPRGFAGEGWALPSRKGQGQLPALPALVGGTAGTRGDKQQRQGARGCLVATPQEGDAGAGQPGASWAHFNSGHPCTG